MSPRNFVFAFRPTISGILRKLSSCDGSFTDVIYDLSITEWGGFIPSLTRTIEIVALLEKKQRKGTEILP